MRRDRVHAPKVAFRSRMQPDQQIYKFPGARQRLVQGALHSATICSAVLLWVWHLGETAAAQPIAHKYGWFFNYMTFVTLSLQLLHNFTALPADLLPGLSVQWHRFVDDFGCAVFGPVLFVTLSYYGIQCLPLGPLYGDDYQVMSLFHYDQPACYTKNICVPPWVPVGLHSGNSVAAVLDLLLCLRHRNFRKRAKIGQNMVTVGYVIWLLVCKFHTGQFPYPFMEQLPLPSGYGLVSIFMITSCELLFGFGRRVHIVHHQTSPDDMEGSDDHRQETEGIAQSSSATHGARQRPVLSNTTVGNGQST